MRVKKLLGCLLLLGLGVSQSAAVLSYGQSPAQGVMSPRVMSYIYEENRIKLEVDPDFIAIYLPDVEGEEFIIEEMLDQVDPDIPNRMIKEMPYKGLFTAEVSPGSAWAILGRVVPPGQGWVAPYLVYNDRLHIPRPELLVTLTSYDPVIYQRFIDTFGARILREFPSVKPLFLIEHPRPIDFESEIAEFMEFPGVESASPNFIMDLGELIAPNDPAYSAQWHLNNTGQAGTVGVDISAETAWSIQTGGANVTIAVLDEGVDVDHEDLAPNIVAGHDSVTIQASPGGIPGNCDTNDSHGTGCAGLAAARGNNGLGVSGVAWNAQIQPVRMAFGTHWTQNDWIIDAVTWATDNGADILSNSWGGGAPSTAESNTMDYALQTGRGGLGCLLVFASGNESAGVGFPAAYSQTIAVGASSPCDELKTISSCDGENFWGSNSGPQQTVVAPGVLMVTTDIAGVSGMVNGDYVSGFNGTSSATPVVAGALAVILSQDPGLTSAQAQEILQAGADDQVGPANQDPAGFDNNFGHGRVNLANMLALMGGPAAPNNLTCTENAVGVQLSWTAGEPYDSVTIRRDGTLLSTLAGDATGFLDLNVPAGQHNWEIQGFVATTPSIGRQCSLFLIGDARDLIWSPGTGTVDSGTIFGTNLVQTGRSAVLTSNLLAFNDLDVFDRVWVMLGMFPNNHQITLDESAALVNYLTNGVGGQALYMEGGDTWFFDPQRPIHSEFGITGLSDGSTTDNLAEVAGALVTGCDLSGISLTYTGENTWVDRLAASVGASVVQSNVTPAYDVAVFRDNGGRLTFGASYENGGLSDGLNSTRQQLVQALLECMGGVLTAPADLVCTVNGTAVDVSWTVTGTWDSVQVVVDGGAPQTLPGTSTSVNLGPLGVGSHTIEVSSVLGAEVSIPAACTIGIAPAAPQSLTCTPSGTDVLLAWTNPVTYDSVEILRNSVVIATLPGGSSSMTDVAPGPGAQSYFVRGITGGIDSAATACGVFIPPSAVTALTCTINGNSADLGWTNSHTYDNVQISRNGLLIATLPGSAVTFQDTPGAGNHEWAVTAILQSANSPAVLCSGTILPVAPANLSCSAPGSTVSLTWTNSETYDSIVVRRDGVDLATLPGSNESFSAVVQPGIYTYSVRAAVASVESSETSCQVTRTPLAVTNLDCQFSGGTATLTWAVETGLSSVEVRRDGVLIATLGGSANFLQETSPPGGLRLYSVTAIAGSLTSPASECTLAIPPAAVSSLTCTSATDFTAQLDWLVPGEATAVLVNRNGSLLATLPAGSTGFTDNAAPGGIQTYEVIAEASGIPSDPASCLVDVQVPAAPVVTASVDLSTIELGTPVQFSATSDVAGVTWAWTFGDGQSSTEQNPVHVYSSAGVFSANVIATGPGGTSAPAEVTVSVLQPVFLRGDNNGDGFLDISDPIQALEFMFGTGSVICESALDINDDGIVDLSDVINSLSTIFEGTFTPSAPFPDCGTDPTPDSLACTSQSACP